VSINDGKIRPPIELEPYEQAAVEVANRQIEKDFDERILWDLRP
jgi:hypothetical protein